MKNSTLNLNHLNYRSVVFKIKLIILILSPGLALTQLDSIHYFPPLKQGIENASIQNQRFYLSTPNVSSTNGITIDIYKGTSLVPFETIIGLSNDVPKEYNPGNGNNNITLVSNSNTGIILSNSGLRFVARNGEKFYVNYRGRSTHQAGSLTCKGTSALGNEFRWGGIPNKANHSSLSISLGIIATEDNTEVVISDYDNDCEFRKGNNPDGITSNTITITLNEGQSYVLEAIPSENNANNLGWLGALVSSDKPIAISNGGLNVGVQPNHARRDVGIDQPVPTNLLGKDYVFIRAKGTDLTEFPIIIAVENNTEVFIGASTIADTTLNAGEYAEISGTNYSSTNAGANMYVRTTKPVYAYQCLAGQSGNQTIGLNFIAPLNCLLPTILNEISAINKIAGANSGESAITITASSSTPNENIILTSGSGQVTLPAPSLVEGTSDWKTFYVTNLTGEVSVQSTGPISVGTFMRYGSYAGLAGYFSGFDTAPSVDLAISGTSCYPGSTIEESSNFFDAYQWYLNNEVLTGEVSNTYTPSDIGSYSVDVTRGTCTYSSNSAELYFCYPEIVTRIYLEDSVVNVGDIVDLEIKVQNLHHNNIDNFTLNHDDESQLLTVLSTSLERGEWDDGNWSMGDILPGQIVSLYVTVEIPESASGMILNNVVSHTQDQTDLNQLSDKNSQKIVVIDVLPIELLSFEVKKNNNQKANVNWSTLTEQNNDYFEIYKSKDLQNWENIAKVDGAGNSSSLINYSYVDNYISTGISYYFLKQVDFDGKSVSSSIVSITNNTNKEIKVYPTLFDTEVQVDGVLNNGDEIVMYDILGNVFYKEIVSEVMNNITLDFNDVDAGAYYLRINEKIYNLIKK